MTKEEIKERKLYLISTTNARDILFRYNVKIIGNRCKCFFHGGKDYNAKVFHNGISCFVCNTSFDIFQIVQHFERCDFWTAFQILGGTDEIDESTKEKMRLNKIENDRLDAAEKKQKDIKRRIVEKINLYQKLEKQCEPMSDEWCFCKNRLFYWLYLFEHFTEKEK